MMKVCVQPRSGGRRAYSVRPEKRRGRFPSLPARNERGESWREGKLTKNGLLSPALSSFFGEEREKGIAAAVQANYLPNTIGWKPAIQQVWKPATAWSPR